ncbi:hypothetical protein BJX70DRAFT_77934 [Aspergillus crustosus]
MTTNLNFVTLDVFTTKTFEGNPLGVVFLPPPTDLQPSRHQKQIIAREFNFAETIFVHVKCGNGESRKIEIFTDSVEIPFAGHPTIGAASWFLYHVAEKDAPVRNLSLKAGDFPIALQDESGSVVTATVAHNVHIHRNQFSVDRALKLLPSMKPYLTPTSITLFSVVRGMSQVLVELPSLEALRSVTTANGGEEISSSVLDAGWGEGLVTAYFYVKHVKDEKLGKKVIRARSILGNLEDPATGSAASGLVALLSLKEGRMGQFTYDIVQGVEIGRRSEIEVDVVVGEVGKLESLVLKGSAVKVSEGKIVLPEDF